MNLLQSIRCNARKRYPTLTASPKRPVQPKQPSPDAIFMGRDPLREPVVLPLRKRQEHVFMLGATGSGKTSCLTHYMRQVVGMGEGLIFLDPHGDTAYRDMLSCATNVIDFSSSHVVGFNPLACPEDTDPSVIVGLNAAALSVVWEGERFANSPTGERALKTVLGALVELGLTYCEAKYLYEQHDHTLRRYAIQHVKNSETRDGLKRLDELASDKRRWRDFEQETIFSRNRIARLLDAPTVRAMLGQTKNTLDMPAIMDGGGVLLANLNGGLSVPDMTADLFGKVLTNSVLFHAKRRKSRAPVNLVIDEAHRFMSSVIPVLLAEVRKYGVSVLAAMQWLNQAEDDILPALLNGPGVKIAFRLNDPEEAEQIAKAMVPLNLERPVQALVKPTIVGYRRVGFANEGESENEATTKSRSITEGETDGRSVTVGETEGGSYSRHQSESETETQGAADTESEAEAEHESESETGVPRPLDTPDTIHVTAGGGKSKSKSRSRGSSQSRATTKGSGATETETYAVSRAETRSKARTRAETIGEASTRGSGRTKGFSEGLEPMLEDRPSAVHSMPNELYRAARMLMSLPTGVGYVNYVGDNRSISTLFRVPLIIRRDVPAQSVHGIPRDEALMLIEQRQASFAAPQSSPASKKPAKKPTAPQHDHGEADYY